MDLPLILDPPGDPTLRAFLTHESMTTNFKNFIAGKWVAPSTGRYFENRNPADTTDLIGCFPDSGAEDIEAAVRSAREGFRTWSRTPAPVRGDVLRRVGDRKSVV